MSNKQSETLLKTLSKIGPQYLYCDGITVPAGGCCRLCFHYFIFIEVSYRNRYLPGQSPFRVMIKFGALSIFIPGYDRDSK